MFLGRIKDVYLNLNIFLIVSIFLLAASYFDLKNRKIPNKLNLFFLILRVLVFPIIKLGFDNLYGLLFGFFVVLIPAMIMNKKMGGDIKTMAVLGGYLGLFGTFALVLGVVGYSLMYLIIIKVKDGISIEIPLAPFFLLSFLTISGILFFT